MLLIGLIVWVCYYTVCPICGVVEMLTKCLSPKSTFLPFFFASLYVITYTLYRWGSKKVSFMFKAIPHVSNRQTRTQAQVFWFMTIYIGKFATCFSNLERANEYTNVRWWERLVAEKNINNLHILDWIRVKMWH